MGDQRPAGDSLPGSAKPETASTSAATWPNGAPGPRTEVGLILMGNPKNMGGAEGRQSRWAREFARRIEERIVFPSNSGTEGRYQRGSRPVLRFERHQHRKKRAAGGGPSFRRYLLQSYLDSVALGGVE